MATLTAVVVTSLLMSIQYDYDWQLLVVSCAMSVGGAFSIFIVRRRTDMTRAAIKATGFPSPRYRRDHAGDGIRRHGIRRGTGCCSFR